MDYHDPVPRPTLVLGEDGLEPTVIPAGWDKILVGVDEPDAPQVVLCGWTEDGEFHQYADTETIARCFFASLEQAHA